MILSNGETYFSIGLEATIFIHEYDVWRFEGILKRKKNGAMVNTLVKLCILWSLNGEMPCIEIIR